MAYYEHEILHELNIGEQYTEKQLLIFVVENSNVIVISKSCSQFTEHSQAMHIVLDIIEGYEHKGNNARTYHIPRKKSKIYVVE